MATAQPLRSEPPLHDWAYEQREARELAIERETEAILAGARGHFRDFQELLEDAFYYARDVDAQEQLDRALWRFYQGDYQPLVDLLAKRLVTTAHELAREKLGEPS